jgi:hypothetical protein
MAALDPTTGQLRDGHPVNNSWTDGVVRALAVSGDLIYVGGYFTQLAGVRKPGIGALDVRTGEVTPWSPEYMVLQALSQVNAIAVTNHTFTQKAMCPVLAAHGSAALPPGCDHREMEIRNLEPAVYGYVHAMTVSGGLLYVGGTLNPSAAAQKQHCCPGHRHRNATDWNPRLRNGSSPYVSVRVMAFSEPENRLYIGGNFSAINGQTRHNAAAFDVATVSWSTIGTPVPEEAFGPWPLRATRSSWAVIFLRRG